MSSSALLRAAEQPVPVSPSRATDQLTGLALGGVAVAAFSLTMPMTRLALRDLDPLAMASGRAAIAAALAVPLLLARRARLPSVRVALRLLAVGLCVAVGFPVTIAWAMQEGSASQAGVILGLAPMATAAFAALRYGETRPARFWWMSLAATLTVVAFARFHGGGAFRPSDALLLLSVFFTAAGYGMGAQLTRELPSVEVIAWAVLLVAPLTVPWAIVAMRDLHSLPGLPAMAGLIYVGTISQLLGFIPWYTGLARGGVTTVSQVQLLQPFLTFLAAAVLLGEPLPPSLWVFGGLVALFVWLGRR